MTTVFSEHVDKIVNNYLKRLKSYLKGLPEQDKEELVKEIHSHIYESFVNDPTENEIDRILNVLNKLGEPSNVISSRVSTAMVSMGKKQKLPFYILAGILIALFGLPLRITGISVLICIIVTVCILILAYYMTAIVLVISGAVGAIASIIRIIDPYFLTEYIQIYDIIPDPRVGSILGLITSILIVGLGFGMIWLGKYMMRGIKFLFKLTLDRTKESRNKRRQEAMNY